MSARLISYILIIAASFLLQTTLIANFEIGGITPNLVLIEIILFSLFLPLNQIIILSFLGGLLFDLFSSQFFGFSIISFMAVGLIFNAAKYYLFARVNIYIVLVAVFFGTILYYLLNFFLFEIVEQIGILEFISPTPIKYGLFYLIPIEAIYNLAGAIILFLFFGRNKDNGSELR